MRFLINYFLSARTSTPHSSTKIRPQTPKELDKKMVNKNTPDGTKRTVKRTRGSMSIESNSPSTTPPPVINKRRRN